jgi:hypothetical protein
MAGFQEGCCEAMDSKEHLPTFDSFISGTKWGTGLIVLALILMAFFLL